MVENVCEEALGWAEEADCSALDLRAQSWLTDAWAPGQLIGWGLS